MCGVTSDKRRSRVFPPFLSTLYAIKRPRFGLVKVTGIDGRLKIIKLENSNLVCYSSDNNSTLKVEMKRHQEEDGDDDDDDDQQEGDGNDENNQNEVETIIAAKGSSNEMLFLSVVSERLWEMLNLIPNMINESSRLMSGWIKMWGVTEDKVRPQNTFPPTLFIEGRKGRSRLDLKKVMGSDHGPLNEDINLCCREDDDGNDGNDDDDDDDYVEGVGGGNNNGENKEEEMIIIGDDEENQTVEKSGDDSDQDDDDDDDDGKNSKKKKINKKKKKKNKKTNRKKT